MNALSSSSALAPGTAGAVHADVGAYVRGVCAAARAASAAMGRAPSRAKNLALAELARGLRARRDDILAANAADVARARTAGLDSAALDRLALTARSVEAMAAGVEQIERLGDPIGEIGEVRPMPSGI